MEPPAPKTLPPLSFMADSSSKDDTFMVAGGFAVRGDRVAEIETTISELRASVGIRSEFHWKDYRGGNRRVAYEALVSLAFDLIEKNHAHFHLAIAKFQGKEGERLERVPKDRRINGIYENLLIHRVARFYGKNTAIHCIFDSGDDCAGVVGRRNFICAAAYRKYQTAPNCIRTLEPMRSEKSGLIQMSDVLVGGIGALRNGRQLSSPKANLAEFIHEASRHDDWAINTGAGARKFTVWNVKAKSGLPQP